MEQPELRIEVDGAVDLHWIDWRLFRPVSPLTVDVGGPQDAAYLLDGWYDRERTGGDTVRWTGPQATLFWPCASPGKPSRMTLRHLPQHRAPDFAIRLYCNGVEIHAERMAGPQSDAATLTAKIPEAVQSPTNVIRIETDGWRPGGNDPRTLGLLTDRIAIEPDPL